MALVTHTCPHCSKTFEVESGSGVTAEIREKARQYKAAHPNSKAGEAVNAILMESIIAAKGDPSKAYNVNTVTTQVRSVY